MVHSPLAFRDPSAGRRSIGQKNRVILALVLNQLLSAGTHLFAKATVTAIGPLSTALLRFVGASIALLAFQLLRRSKGIAREDLPMVLFLAFLAVPVNQCLFLFGISRSTASHAALLYALTPVVVLLLAWRFLRERDTASKLLGVVAAFVGEAVILLDRGLARESAILTGDLLMLGAVFAWALYTVASKKLLHRYDAMTLTAWVLIAGTLMCLPGFLIPGAIPPMEALTPPVWGGIAFLAIGTSFIAYPLWLYALRRLEASKVAITTNAQPILTSILSWILFRERFTPAFFLGGALILFGVTWVETRKGGVAIAGVVRGRARGEAREP